MNGRPRIAVGLSPGRPADCREGRTAADNRQPLTSTPGDRRSEVCSRLHQTRHGRRTATPPASAAFGATPAAMPKPDLEIDISSLTGVKSGMISLPSLHLEAYQRALTSNPQLFSVPNLSQAKGIILRAESSTTEERWRTETPMLSDLITARNRIGPDTVVLDYGCGIG